MNTRSNRSRPAFAPPCLIFCFLGVANAWSQSKSQPKPEAEIIISSLLPPVYPPFTKQTRISGEVQLTVGSVAAPVVLQGHPLLVQAAINSVPNSKFERRNCGDEAVWYRLTYSFTLGQQVTVRRQLTAVKDDNKEKRYPRVSQSQNTVTLPTGRWGLATYEGR